MTRLPSIWRSPMGLSRNIDRMFNDFFTNWNEWPFEGAAVGRTDIYEQDGKLVYETELPGVKREDIHIKVEGNQLLVSGEAKRETDVQEENYVRMGRRVGRFQRSFPLPEQVDDPKSIEAKYEDGVLRVHVPLSSSITEEEKPIEIQVK